MPTEHVFLGEIVNARKVICPLVRLHSLQKLYSYRTVVPRYIPGCIHPFSQMILKIELGDLLDNIVVRMISVHHQSIRLVGDILRVQLTLLLLLVARREPIRVI